MILVAFRHGLRASEVCDLQWHQIELSLRRVAAGGHMPKPWQPLNVLMIAEQALSSSRGYRSV